MQLNSVVCTGISLQASCFTPMAQAHTDFCMHSPRHEIVGVVTAVGAEVDSFKVGDLAGVGCMVESCRKCAQPQILLLRTSVACTYACAV